MISTLVGCAAVKPTAALNLLTPSGGYTKQQFSYGSHRRQALDLYLPKTSTTKIPVVFVYGGAWRSGSRQDYAFVAQALTSLGHPVIIPDYRLYPEVQFPVFIDDVADAIRFVDQTNLGLPQPFKDFILMGHSAGAHSAALLAADSRYLRNRGIKARLAGLIGIAGPYDLPMDDPEVRPVFMTSTSDRTKVVSNVTQGMPPTLLLHGFADTRVKPFHTERFRDALIKNGNSVTTRLYPGVNHTKIIGSLAAPLRFLNNSFKDVKAFLARYN
jgi:acetyl esterase/lipase